MTEIIVPVVLIRNNAVQRYTKKSLHLSLQKMHLTGQKASGTCRVKNLAVWEKVGDYYIGVRRVLTNIFGKREALAYVTASDKAEGTRRLFFSTVFP